MLRKCFFICPIGEEGSSTREHTNAVMKYILQPVFEVSNNIEIVRADKIVSINEITDDVIENLENDEFAVADLTELNPNVFYEVGYRAALKLPTMLIAEKGTKLPFDIAGIRTDFFTLDLKEVDETKNILLKKIDMIARKERKECGDVSETGEKPYMKILREIVDRYTKNNNKPLIYGSEEIDINDIRILIGKKYLTGEIGKNTIILSPTPEGLEYVLYGS